MKEVNLEILYPELKDMKSSEIFIEWAYIITGGDLVQKVHLRRIISRGERSALVRALKLIYVVDNKEDKEELFSTVDLVTIEK